MSASQYLFQYRGRTRVLSIDSSCVAVYDELIREISDREGLPIEDFRLTCGKLELKNRDVVVPQAPSILNVMMGLKGGKGGFGAMLRAQAKGKGAKTTTDFGACRDLQGRRLRHVNDEIRVQKWAARQEAIDARKRDGKPYDDLLEEEKTDSGIEGWYLAAPSWAEGIKKKNRTRYNRKKTMICPQWQQARQYRKAPASAPNHWGCPRGKDCDFAHGEDELRGDGLKEFQKEKKKEKELKHSMSERDYCTLNDEVSANMAESIKVGMRNKKKLKKGIKLGEIEDEEGDDEKKGGAEVDERNKMGNDGEEEDEADVIKSVVTDGAICDLAGEITIAADGTVIGVSSFGSIRGLVGDLCRSKWYYEVEIKSDGIIQIGFADGLHEGLQEDGNGIGDDKHSWSFDGLRQRKWNGEEGEEGVEYGKKWKVGDIIGVLFNADKRTISYQINGKDLGVAFENIDTSNGLYPALSLESQESCKVNLGQFPFKYLPSSFSSVWSSREGSGEEKKEKEVIEAKSVAVHESKKRNSDSVNSSPNNRKKSKQQVDNSPVAEEKKEEEVELINLDKINNVDKLIKLGADRLKEDLKQRGVKCGGTLQERAERLFSLKGLDEIPAALKAKK